MAGSSLEVGAHALLVGRIEQEGQGRLEPVGDLCLMRRQRQVRWNQPDNGGNSEASHRSVTIGGPPQFDARRRKAELFLGFAQGGSEAILALVHPPPGKTDLPGMSAQMLAPHSQDDARFGPVGHRHQHRGLAAGPVAVIDIPRQQACAWRQRQ